MKIAITVLTWNNVKDTKTLLRSLRGDALYLAENHEVCFLISDNGSTDGTLEFFEYFADHISVPVEIHAFESNMGISVAKNVSIDKCVERGFDYMFMFDNDVAIIPNSLPRFIDYMETHPEVGCFGQHIDYYKRDRHDPEIPQIFPSLESLNIVSNVKSGCGATRAWTHYSIYRGSMLADGVKFDTEGPFGSAGYGFDDDDLGMQIVTAGHRIDCFTDVHCYHNVNSSVKPLSDEKMMNFHEREAYLKDKWRL